MKKISILILAVFLGVFIIGCSGGGDEGVDTETPDPIPADEALPNAEPIPEDSATR